MQKAKAWVSCPCGKRAMLVEAGRAKRCAAGPAYAASHHHYRCNAGHNSLSHQHGYLGKGGCRYGGMVVL